MEIVSPAPLLAVAVSLAVVVPLILSRTPDRREAWTFAAAGLKFLVVAAMAPAVLAGKTVTCTVAPLLPGVPLQFRVDAAGIGFALVASFLWIVTSLYSVGYLRGLHEHGQTRFFCFFALSLSATIGVAFAANLLTLYLFYEMLSLATYPLVTHHQDADARRSGRKYLLYIMGASIGLALPAMVAAAALSGGQLDFVPGGVLPDDLARGTAVALLLLFVFGFAKAAVMPLHSWLPAAMVAPTPVSALLHAVAVVKVGVFCIFRALTGIMGVDLLRSLHLGGVVCTLAAVTVLTASLIAMSQDGLKRRLAFSTIGQLSYILLGVGLLSLRGLTGGLLHIAMHAFGKITLFFCAGAIFVATGKTRISQMAGIGRRMPVTMGAFFIGALSVIGLPPCGGFISKWHLVLGTLEADRPFMLAVLLTSSLLNGVYFLPIVYRAYFRPPADGPELPGVSEAPRWCVVPPVAAALISLGLFFYPQPFLNLARAAGRVLLGGG